MARVVPTPMRPPQLLNATNVSSSVPKEATKQRRPGNPRRNEVSWKSEGPNSVALNFLRELHSFDWGRVESVHMKPWMMTRPMVEHVMMANDKKHLGVFAI